MYLGHNACSFSPACSFSLFQLEVLAEDGRAELVLTIYDWVIEQICAV
jgi:hypothetical protein